MTLYNAQPQGDPRRGHWLNFSPNPGQVQHDFCGAHDIAGATCPYCNKPLLRILSLSAEDPVLNLEQGKTPVVHLLYCWTCSIPFGEFSYRINADGSVEFVHVPERQHDREFGLAGPFDGYKGVYPLCKVSLEPMDEQDDGHVPGSARKEFGDGPPPPRVRVAPSGQKEGPIDRHNLILEEPDPSPGEEFAAARPGEALMVPRDGEEAISGDHPAERPRVTARVLVPPVALQDVAADQDGIRLLGVDLGHEIVEEAVGGHPPEVKVGHKDDRQLPGRRGKATDIEAVLLDPQDPVVDHPVDDEQGRECQAKDEAASFESLGPDGLPRYDARQSKGSEDEVGRDDGHDQVKKEREGAIAEKDDDLCPTVARPVGQAFGDRIAGGQEDEEGGRDVPEALAVDEGPDAQAYVEG